MMGSRVLFCADRATCANPELVGLDGERLEGQGWLEICNDGNEARMRAAGLTEADEAWVASSEDVSAINLAATLKRDNPGLTVKLVDFEKDGSLMSRAHTAQIDEVMGRDALVMRYAALKGEGAADRVSSTPGLGENAQTKPQGQLVLARRQPTADRPRGFVMPVVSGSGGAGKSAIAVISALIAVELGYKTLLLDYDLQFGDAAIMAGSAAALAVDEAVARPDRLEAEIAKGGALVVLAAPSRLEAAEAVAHGVPALLDSLAEKFDVVVANTGASWAEYHAALLERSTTALCVIDQRASSVRACRHALELCARCGIATGQFQFVLNRCAKAAPLTAADVSCALQGAPVFELRDGGRDVEDYLAAGAASELVESGNELVSSLRRLLADTLPAAPQASPLALSPKPRSAAKRRGRHSGKRKAWGR